MGMAPSAPGVTIVQSPGRWIGPAPAPPNWPIAHGRYASASASTQEVMRCPRIALAEPSGRVQAPLSLASPSNSALVATAFTWEIAVSTVPAMERNPFVPPAAAV